MNLSLFKYFLKIYWFIEDVSNVLKLKKTLIN